MATRSSERPASGDRKREALLAAAYDLIADKGLAGLRTRDIVERAGVNISMLHYYFGTKEGLILAVVAHTREQWKGGDDEHAPQSLHEHLAAAWQSFRDDPRLAAVLQELALRALRDEATRAAFDEIFRGWNRRVAELVAREQRLGQRPAGLDPQRAAVVVTSFVMGAQMQLGVNPTAFDFAAAARQLDHMLTAAAV